MSTPQLGTEYSLSLSFLPNGRRVQWNRREKEKLHAQQIELKTISNEEHITHTSISLDDDDIGPRAPTVSFPQVRGPSHTFSQFLRSVKRRATRRHDAEEVTPEQPKSRTLPADITASSKL